MSEYLDSGTVRVSIVPSGVSVLTGIDSATVNVDIVPSGIDKHLKPDFTGEGLAYNRFSAFEGFQRFEAEPMERFTTRLRFGA